MRFLNCEIVIYWNLCWERRSSISLYMKNILWRVNIPVLLFTRINFYWLWFSFSRLIDVHLYLSSKRFVCKCRRRKCSSVEVVRGKSQQVMFNMTYPSVSHHFSLIYAFSLLWNKACIYVYYIFWYTVKLKLID